MHRACRLLAALALLSACGPLDDDVPPQTPANVQEVPIQTEVAVDPNADVYADTDPSALTDFHATLDAHGAWVEDPNYGTVWVPNPAEVGPDFTPYETAGHWAYDDVDYVWTSDYDWGWAPFHYGRWMYAPTGWVWVPGREYAPAWVTWRMGAPGYAYVGWAPMSAGFYWRGGIAVGVAPMIVAPGAYAYCAHGDLFSASVSAHVVARAQVGEVAAHTQGFAGAGAAGGGFHGPAPASMGIAPSAVTRASPNDRGAQMARNFSRPSTAKAMGGHAPTPHKFVPAPRRKAAASHAPRGGAVRGGGGGHHR
jgi:hypothetical protein